MKVNIQKRIFNSFTEYERDDYMDICGWIDHNTFDCIKDVVLLSKNPYLLLLSFTALMRYRDINIHIINPIEGKIEIQRLIYVIQPDLVISTDHDHTFRGCKQIFVAPEYVDYEMKHLPVVEDISFRLYTYSPFPTKINYIEGEVFSVLIDSLIYDLSKFDIIDQNNLGLASVVTNSSDYLIYFIAVKLTNNNVILPSEEEFDWCMTNKKSYFEHNKSNALIITKKELTQLWEREVMSLFQNKFVFWCFTKIPWITNILIRRRLKKVFKGFNKILIIGILENSYMIDMLKNLSFIKFYSIFPLENVLMYGSISQSLDSIIISSNDFRQDHFVPINDYKNPTAYEHSVKLYSHLSSAFISDIKHLFVEGNDIVINGEKRKQYFLLGNKDNAFFNENKFLFPETLEKVINSYPFIRHSALLTFNNKNWLIIVPNADILDANRINYGAFNAIIKNQIVALNKELPDEYKIQNFLVSLDLLEINRFGEISKFALNQCNK